jgi:hypothetical protein
MPGTEDFNKKWEEISNQSANNLLQNEMSLYNPNEQMTPYAYNAGTKGPAFFKRYYAYGPETFERIGFSPFKDNEKIFNEGVSGAAELKRSLVHGFAPLFIRGFVSGPKSLGKMAQGDFGEDEEEAEAYAEASAIASSTRGGITGFVGNMLTNFGYTAGIITEAIAEEVLTAGLSTEYTIFNAGKNLARGMTYVGRAPKVARGVLATESVLSRTKTLGSTLKKLDNITEARNYVNSLKVNKTIGNVATKSKSTGKAVLDFFNPLSNTTEAIIDVAKNSKNLQGLSKGANAVFKTAGGLYRDIRNVNMALSEARLEAGFTKKETLEQLYDEYRETHNGEDPSAELYDNMKETAQNAANGSLIANTILIYATNKVAFDNIMSPKKGLNKIINKKISQVKQNVAGRTFREFTEKTLSTGRKVLTPKLTTIKSGWKGFRGTAQAVKKLGARQVAKNVIGYTKANIMEGIQESMQDVIAKTSKDYYTEAFYSEPVASYYYTEAYINNKNNDGRSIWDNVKEGFQAQVYETNERGEFVDEFGKPILRGENKEKQLSGRGLETFASGFAMGILAGPINKALPFAQKQIARLRNKEQYDAAKKRMQEYNDGMSAKINKTLADDPLNMYNARLYNLGVQSKLAEQIADPDTKAKQDAIEEATVRQISQMIEMNSTDIWLDHLENIKGLTQEEYAEYFGISVEQAEGHTQKIDQIIGRTKDIVKNYEEVKEMYPNPVDLSLYEKGSVEYQKAALFSTAWDEAVRNVIFYNDNYKTTLSRMSKVYTAMTSDKIIGKVDPLRVQPLFNENDLDGEIGRLRTEVEALKGSTTPESKKLLEQRKESLKALEEYRQSYNEFMNHFYKTARSQEDIEIDFIESELSKIETKLKAKPKRSERIQLEREQKRLNARLAQFNETGISDQSKTSESYSEDVVQVREPRKSGYKNTIVKKTETTDEKGRKEVKYERYAVDENGNERKMSREGIGTTVGEFAPLTNENNLFYDDDGNLTYDANAEVNINSVTEYKDENGNTKYSTKLSVRAKGKGPFDTRIITNVNPVNEGTYRTESISKFQGTSVSNKTEERKQKRQELQNKKDRLIEINNEIDQLENTKNNLSTPEYYEQFLQGKVDSQYQEREIERIERKISNLEKEKSELDAEVESTVDSINTVKLSQLEGSFKRYLKTLADQSNETLLEKNIEEAFDLLIDYYRLGREAQGMADAINILNDPSGFADHVDNNFNWMSDLWENREDMIRKNITEQTKRIQYNNLLNLLAAEEIYVDLDEFANWKENGELPTEFYDAKNKRVIPKGSILYNQVAEKFIGLDFLNSIEQNRKSPEQKLKEKLKMLDALEQEEIDSLQQYNMRVDISNIDETEFTLNSVKDKIGIDQYLEATYTSADGLPISITFYKDADGNIKYNDNDGSVVGSISLKLREGKIFAYKQQPDPVEVKAIKDKYDQLRAEAAEGSIAETSSVILEGGEVSLDDLSVNTPIENMPAELREKLIEAFDIYRTDPNNEYLFPDNLTQADLDEKFAKYITTEPEAINIVEEYIKEQRLKAATTQGQAAPPIFTLSNGKRISAEDATDEQIQTVLKRYNLEISDLENKRNKSVDDELRLKELKEQYSLLEAYVKNRINKAFTPEMQNALELIKQLQKEQERIEALPTGYKIGQKILRRVTNVIQKFLGKKYEYDKKDVLLAAYNLTIGEGQSVKDFIDVLKSSNLPGFNEKSYEAIEKFINEYNDPDLKDIDPALLAARRGDKKAQEEFEKFGLEWEQTTTYRFVGQSEVDVLLSGKNVDSKRGMADAGIDVTTSPKVTTAATNEYRVTFKESFDVNNGLGKVRQKNKELGDHNLKKGRGYSLNDVAKIEKLDENGNVVETIYSPNIDSLKDATINFITEQATYQWGRDRGNVIDDLTKKYFSGVKIQPNLNEISQEAFDSLYGRNGIYKTIKDYIDTNDLIVVANGLIVYDEDANVAGEIDLLVVDRKGNFQIIDIKTGETAKWAGYNNPQNKNYAKQIENTYQQMVYARLLKNMFGIDAKINILPIETTSDITTGKILTAKRPTSPDLLEADKIVFPLKPTQEMYDKLNAEIPETKPKFNGTVPSDDVNDTINDPNLDDVEGTDYENENPEGEEGTEPNNLKEFNALKSKIEKADFDELQIIMVDLTLNSLKYTAEQFSELNSLIEARQEALKVQDENEEGEVITYNVGDQVYSESDIFTSTNRKFLSANQTAVISEISGDRITVKPEGKRTKMEMSIEEFKKKFKPANTLFSGQGSPGPTVDESEGVTQESTDTVSDLLDGQDAASRQKDLEDQAIVENTRDNLLDDLDC